MVSFPPCKINLGLHILDKRSDGYHNIETCFFPLPFTDVLEILPAGKMSVTMTGLPIPGNPGENLTLRAYDLMKNDLGLPPVHLHLHKIIPMGAGLGGGSSDAAHTIRLLDAVFGCQLPHETQRSYAQQLGSDCSFFLQDGPKIGAGRGEILSDATVDLKGKFVVVVMPGIHVSTAEAYGMVQPKKPSAGISSLLAKPIRAWRQDLANDFEPSVFSKHPALKQIKERLYSLGALYASMSGSGSSLYGIFESQADSSGFRREGQCWSGWL